MDPIVRAPSQTSTVVTTPARPAPAPAAGRSAFEVMLAARRQKVVNSAPVNRTPLPSQTVSPKLLGQRTAVNEVPGVTRPIQAAGAPARGEVARRVFQRDPAEYRSATETAAWGPSACSAATLTAVARARGSNVKISDVIDRLGSGIDRQVGLLDRRKLAQVANDLGMPTGVRTMDYQGLREAVKAGHPVMTDITNGQFPDGHWLVVSGVDDAGVSVVDSSGYNLTRIDRQTFERSWSRSALVVE